MQTEASAHRFTVRRFSLRGMMLGVTIAAVLFAGLHYVVVAVRHIRHQQRQLQAARDLAWIGQSLHDFDSQLRSLPHPTYRRTPNVENWNKQQDPSAEALYSWRFAIIPFVAGYKLTSDFDQAWDAPVNAHWHTVAQPFSGWGSTSETNAALNITRAFAIIGPGTAFGDGAKELPRSLGELDGDTILVVEVRNSGIHWMAPGDFDIRTMPKTINDPEGTGISGEFAEGFHVLFADTKVWYLSSDTPFERLELFFTVEGAKENDRETVLGQYRVK